MEENGNQTSTGYIQSIPENVENDESFFQIIKNRRSIRKYKQYKIPQQHLKKILNAARLAPSAENSQPWRFIVVRDQAMKEILAEVASGQQFIANANAVIVVIGERGASCCPDTTSWHIMDPMIAAEHLVLAATVLGYGSCWVAMYETRPQQAIAIVKKTLGIPVNSEIVALVTIGLPNETPPARPRKELGEIVFDEVYGNNWMEV
jgi:nitroreductase